MFWGADDPYASLRSVKSVGLRCGHLGIGGHMSLEGAAGRWRNALEQEDFVATNVVGSYPGESYADIPTVKQTVGFTPTATRDERVARTRELIDFAAAIGTPIFCCHAGYVPEDPSDPVYAGVRDAVRGISDHAAGRNITFALETGQETAKGLAQFLKDVDRPNLKINFDPANIILYGVGDPIEALDLLAADVVSVHVKDGIFPPKDQPDALGTEKPLGQGEVGMERFVAKLKEIGYTGPLTIEREIASADESERHVPGLPHLDDVRAAIALLERLR
ncbi:MAG: sugar phosphate isomerase/epimerase [bacterium]|nr:sugar phosphate isomerase/epimerase [bacterium]